MSILRDKTIGEYIAKNYPDAIIADFKDEKSGLSFYNTEELAELEGDWFPLCCYKDEKSGKVIYGGRDRVYHTYTEGETGAGKTTRFVMQAIRALASTKNKPSFVVVDIHGEIVENLYAYLRKQGYGIKILNCDNPDRSDTYNPFSEIARECYERSEITTDALDRIRRISEIIQPIESAHDPVWDRGARAYTNGCILDKFEDMVEGKIGPECLTLYNVIQNHYWIREHLDENPYGTGKIFNIPHYKKKGSNALSVQKMMAVTDNAERTRASYFGVTENHYDIFGQPSFYKLSSSDTIDISDFIQKPTAIVIQSGSTKMGDDLISMLINDIYTRAVKIGRDSPTKKLPRNIHCFLDEFANCNIADGPDYVKMLTTSRKFGMFWHMILQCDAQLNRKFDQDIGAIIRSNSTEIFMGSQDYETQVRFANSCGKKTIESLSSIMAQSSPILETVPLMTAESLNLIPEGYAFVKSSKNPLLKTFIEAFYNCDEFNDKIDLNKIYPYNDFDYTKTLAYPDDESSRHIMREAPRSTLQRQRPVAPPVADRPKPSTPFEDLWSVDEKISQLDDLEKHIPTNPKDSVWKNTLKEVTCIPDFLRDAALTILAGKKYRGEFAKNENLLKFEIIEAYIKANDFKTKREWNDKLSKEYDRLSAHGIFPPSILKAFKQARDELCNELSLGNIKEIKKIISE